LGFARSSEAAKNVFYFPMKHVSQDHPKKASYVVRSTLEASKKKNRYALPFASVRRSRTFSDLWCLDYAYDVKASKEFSADRVVGLTH
jgi:hypothetical protein